METEQLKVGDWVRFIKAEPSYEWEEKNILGEVAKVLQIETGLTDMEEEVYVSFPSIQSWFYTWQVERITEQQAMLFKLGN